ncbi:MAG TPA: GAF and ANTAR domain-containing protein [Acidimicrobiales bacterium]|nr:GAF and ANTAR domain-containing protein [Acidimicrobiales bacterium]
MTRSGQTLEADRAPPNLQWAMPSTRAEERGAATELPSHCVVGHTRSRQRRTGPKARKFEAMAASVGEQELAETFAEIARVLLAEPDVQRTLVKMCELLVTTVAGCDHAVVTVVHGQDLASPAASDDVGPAVDAIQLDVDDGPCLEAIREHQTVVTDDLAVETRWPRFSRRAIEATGVRSMLAFRMFIAEDTLGSLNLYSKQPRAFTDESFVVGTIFAAHASVALRAAQNKEDLARFREVAKARELIGQAKGILMGRLGISSQAAMNILSRGAERLNIELRELARRIVEAEEDDARGPERDLRRSPPSRRLEEPSSS